MMSDSEVTRLSTAADVTALAAKIYGDPLDDVSSGPRVLHPTAVWRRGDGVLLTLVINEHSPRSVHDFFALNLCRARADAIVTTGKILRQEPDLRHELQGPERAPEALSAWRRRQLGTTAPPRTLILTSGRGFDPAHPLLAGGRRPWIFTSPAGRERLVEIDAAEVLAVDDPSLRSAISFLHTSGGGTTVSIETGPSTSTQLYEAPLAVDELLLSIYEAPELDERVQGGPFVDLERIGELFDRPHPPYRIRTASGLWSFLRFLRRGV